MPSRLVTWGGARWSTSFLLLQSRDGRDNVHKLYLGVHNWVEGGSKRKRRHKSHGAKINPRKFR